MFIIMSISESGSGGIVGRAGVVIGLSLLAWQASTAWQVVRAETAAAVDASGRVVAIRQDADRPEVIGRTPIASCGEASALSTDAAKALVSRIAAEEGFYPEFVLSVAKIESRYDSTARSEKGAYGLMQLMPDTAQRFKVDLCDPEGNVRGGIRLLRTLHARYRNPLFILAAYNAGEDAVRKSRGVPPFPETVRFVADVLNDFYTWPNPAGGPTTVLAAASGPGILEMEGSRATPAPFLPPGKPSGPHTPSTKPAAPQWSDGFVMHVE